ncbi:NAD(P)-dependent oxidoreductase [Rhodococcus sp. DMU1]|uniref:NAD(P)-dependent oxidoreductase n=1 Tax=Rhodococcus sp. DMU1 TaxID=2722825 RepID=UPI00143E908C|nr:NAD(P)-dependent oxidoreductase [Rhodococcus sp. DMU1]QIX52654.1 NAD(P)-dependent oxidoreductase [Rhodococcus sp. DMU1]
MSRIGFVGAGRMGRPMVERLVRDGHDVQVLARSDEADDALTGIGAHPVRRLADVAADADIVIVCVFTDAQVHEVCLDETFLSALPAGAVLVVHTTISPDTVEAVAGRAAAFGVDVVDAAVSGGPHDIAAGRLTLFVGGADDTVARVRPVLGSYGDPVFHVGRLGNGLCVKLVNNALFAANIGLISEAVRLGGQLGVDESALLEALPHGSSASRVMGNIAARGSVAAFTSAVGEFLDKDVAVVRSVAAELGGELGVLLDAIEAQPKVPSV